jgi:hypothetical protein
MASWKFVIVLSFVVILGVLYMINLVYWNMMADLGESLPVSASILSVILQTMRRVFEE